MANLAAMKANLGQLMAVNHANGLLTNQANTANSQDMIKEISVQEVQIGLAQDALILVDVREHKEYEYCSVKGSILSPLSSLEQDIEKLPKGKKLALMCHHGSRSQRAGAILVPLGYDVVNVTGGIHAWSLEIDSSVATY